MKNLHKLYKIAKAFVKEYEEQLQNIEVANPFIFEEVTEITPEMGKKIVPKTISKDKLIQTSNPSSDWIDDFKSNKMVKDGVSPNQISLLDEIKEKEKSSAKKEKKSSLFDIDIHFSEPKKLEVLHQWLNYRKEIKKTIRSKSTFLKLCDKFQDESLQSCIDTVNKSIENGWQGLFWDNKPNAKQPQQKKPRVDIGSKNLEKYQKKYGK